MKGIRKLFLGLVFLTLFSVGFKNNVQAATGTLTQDMTNWGSGEATTTAFTGVANYVEGDFPGDPGSGEYSAKKKYQTQIKVGSQLVATSPIWLWKYNNTNYIH